MEGKIKVAERLTPEVKKIIKKLVFANRTTDRIVELLIQKGHVNGNNREEVLSTIKQMKRQKGSFGLFLFMLGIVLLIASIIVVSIGVSSHNPKTPYIDLIIAGYIIYLGNKLKKVSE